MACSRCQRDVYIPCKDQSDCEELEDVQKQCDHDWEFFENEGYKQCTCPECQKEQEMTEDDYESIELTVQQLSEYEQRYT